MTFARILLLTAVLGGLSACVQSQKYLASDFGVAVRQDVAAQIADPDARYPAATPSDGARAALGYDRYQAGKSIPPSSGAMAVGGGSGGSGGQGAPR
jgi:type IV pilus biogenesis protein CpaD/CtpE